MHNAHTSLFGLSLILFVIEVLLLMRLRASMANPALAPDEIFEDDPYLEKALQMLPYVNADFMILYALIYFILLWLGWQMHFILILMVFVQSLSVCTELYVAYRIYLKTT